jgi:hypothetical protein
VSSKSWSKIFFDAEISVKIHHEISVIFKKLQQENFIHIFEFLASKNPGAQMFMFFQLVFITLQGAKVTYLLVYFSISTIL